MPDPISGPAPRPPPYTDYSKGTADAETVAFVKGTPTGLADQENDILPDAVRRIFVGHTELVDPKPSTDQNFQEASGRLNGLLSDGVNLQEIAKLIQTTNLEMRKTMREDRAANRDMDIAKQQEAAQKMRDQAAFAFAASVTMSAFSIAGSAVSIAGSVKGAKAGMDVDAASASGSKSKYTFSEDAPETTPGTKMKGPNGVDVDVEASSVAPKPNTGQKGSQDIAETRLEESARAPGKRGGMIEDVNMPEDVKAATGPQGTGKRTGFHEDEMPDDLKAALDAQKPGHASGKGDAEDGPETIRTKERSSSTTSSEGGVETSPSKTSGQRSQEKATDLAKEGMEKSADKGTKPPVEEDDGIPKDKLEALTEQNRIKKANLAQENVQNKFQAAGNVITESGKIIGAGLNYEASMQEAEKADINAEASKARTRAEDDSDYIKAYSDSIQAVIQKLSDMQSSEADTMRQIVRG